MKIQDAKRAYSAQMNVLQSKRLTLTQMLKKEESGAGVFDRVELSRELSSVESQYTALQGIMEGITATESAIRDTEASRQQSDAMIEAAKDLGKILEVYRRIASGGTVPAEDEKKLMDYSHELYMAAKTAAMLAKQNDEEYDSLWEDEEDPGEQKNPDEIAGETEVAVPSPEKAAAAAAAAPVETAD